MCISYYIIFNYCGPFYVRKRCVFNFRIVQKYYRLKKVGIERSTSLYLSFNGNENLLFRYLSSKFMSVTLGTTKNGKFGIVFKFEPYQ